MRYLFFLLLTVPGFVFAQTGGKSSFDFVTVPVNARIAALGGINVSLRDQNVNLFQQNPAALNPEMARHLSVSYLPYIADIKATNLAYAFRGNGKNNMYGVGLTFFDYGKMNETDASGAVVGTFRVSEYMVTGSASHKISNYVLGVSLKFAGSQFPSNNAVAVLADFGGMFVHPERDWTIGLTVKNLGYAIKKYYSATQVNLPFDVQLGTSYKLEHLPLRFSLTAQRLTQYDIVYLDPNQAKTKDLQGNVIQQKKKVGDEILRHLVVGAELLLSKNLNLRVGYNHLRRRELAVAQRSALTGFAMGFMLKVSSFELGYTHAFYTFGTGSNSLTLITNFNTILKKRARKNN